MVLSICCVPGTCKVTWEVVPREVETLAKVCTAKKHLNVAQNKSHVMPLCVVVLVHLCVLRVRGQPSGVRSQGSGVSSFLLNVPMIKPRLVWPEFYLLSRSAAHTPWSLADMGRGPEPPGSIFLLTLNHGLL